MLMVWDSIHYAEQPAMVSRQWRIIQAPVFQVVEIPLGYGQVRGYLHPVSLSLKVAMHRRSLEACILLIFAHNLLFRVMFDT